MQFRSSLPSLPFLISYPISVPNDASDGPLDTDGDGYTNVEEFLNVTDPG